MSIIITGVNYWCSGVFEIYYRLYVHNYGSPNSHELNQLESSPIELESS